MNNQLVIRLAESGLNAEQLVDWNLYDDDQALIAQGSHTLAILHSQVTTQCDVFDVSVIVPGDSVLLTTVAIPSQQLRQIKQALPFMVEELIADDIESVHLALPSGLDLSLPTVDVAVVSHRVLVDWLDELHSNHLSPQQLFIDVLCVPQSTHAITVLIDEENILVRTDKFSGLVIQTEDFEWVFPSIISAIQDKTDQPIKPALMLSSSKQVASEHTQKIVSYIRDTYSDYEIKAIEYEEPVFDVLANTACQNLSSGLNLLQGGYAVNNGTQSNWQQWTKVAAVACIGLFAYLLVTLGSGWYFNTQAEAVERKSIALYKQLFPNERRVVSPRKQMESHLRAVGVGSNGHFLQLLSDAAPQIASVDNPLAFQVDELRFDTDRGDIQFQVQTPSIDTLDSLKQALAQRGLDVEISSAIEQDNYVVGRFAVRNL